MLSISENSTGDCTTLDGINDAILCSVDTSGPNSLVFVTGKDRNSNQQCLHVVTNQGHRRLTIGHKNASGTFDSHEPSTVRVASSMIGNFLLVVETVKTTAGLPFAVGTGQFPHRAYIVRPKLS